MPDSSTAGLAGLLAHELATLHEFVALLELEKTTLVAAQADALPALAEQKSALATRLTDYAQQREAALKALGLAEGRSGMEAWLASNRATVAARNDWRTLLPLAGEARRLNELNGKLIATHLQHNNQALSALMGATERAMTYGPDGQTLTRPGSGRILGSA